MERLITDTGGRPVKNEDFLEYLQAFDIFEQWFDDLNFGDCIVYGCVISGVVGNYTVTAGVLYVSGKLRIFDGVAGVPFPLVLKEESIEINLREFEEGVNKYTAEQLKMIPDVGGAFNFDLTTPRTNEKIQDINGTYTLPPIDIGDWDMDTTTKITINHGLSDITKVVGVKVMIRDDTGSFRADLCSVDLSGNGVVHGGTDGLGLVSLALIRTVGGRFDAAGYSTTPYNRGDIVFEMKR